MFAKACGKSYVRGNRLTELKRFSASYSKVYPQTTKAVREARRAVVDFAATCGFGRQCLEDIEIAVGEALANAVEHGCGGGGEFEVDVRCDAFALTIEVGDSGLGFDHTHSAQRTRPGVESLRGFGTYIMRELMDEIEYSARGTRLRLMKRLPSELHAEPSTTGTP